MCKVMARRNILNILGGREKFPANSPECTMYKYGHQGCMYEV